MFERYTEKARRVIFFSRHEASNYGSPYIEAEHLLLGLFREDRALAERLLGERNVEPRIRADIERRITRGQQFPTNVEVPLSNECKKVLDFAAETAERMGHRLVGTEHLLIGILRVETSLPAQILIARGLEAGPIQEQMAKDHQRAHSRSVTTSAKSAVSTGAAQTLDSFLAGLRCLKSEDLLDFFALNAECIDVTGKRWNREEIGKGFDIVFAHYAKKNASYFVEATLTETRELFVATVLWKNALLASEERVWIHRMSVVLVAEQADWKILLWQVTAVQPPSSTTK